MEPSTTSSDNTRDSYIVAAFMALLVGCAALVLGLR
jgi:hypothetical protein